MYPTIQASGLKNENERRRNIKYLTFLGTFFPRGRRTRTQNSVQKIGNLDPIRRETYLKSEPVPVLRKFMVDREDFSWTQSENRSILSLSLQNTLFRLLASSISPLPRFYFLTQHSFLSVSKIQHIKKKKIKFKIIV